MNSLDTLTLLLALGTKHYFCEFTPLQTGYMLSGKGKSGLKWILPLASHAWIHALFTAFILIVYFPGHLPWLALFDFFVHFVIDRIKASYKLPEGPWEGDALIENKNKHYAAFGLDQYLHFVTYLGIAYLCQ